MPLNISQRVPISFSVLLFLVPAIENLRAEDAVPLELHSEQLLQSAIEAHREKNTAKAITYLRRSLDIDPDNGKARYLLGTYYADAGKYDHAIAEIERATKLEPELHTAHFQLGMLYLITEREARAEKVWKKLNRLGKDHPLYLFKSGLLHLAGDRPREALADLQRGISLNTENAPLNGDMQNIVDGIRKKLKRPVTDG